MKTTASCELRGSRASVVLFPADPAGCARAAPILCVVPLLTMLIPSDARLATPDNGREAWGLTALEASWSDGTIILRSARCLLEKAPNRVAQLDDAGQAI